MCVREEERVCLFSVNLRVFLELHVKTVWEHFKSVKFIFKNDVNSERELHVKMSFVY